MVVATPENVASSDWKRVYLCNKHKDRWAEPRVRPLQSENVLASWVESPRERGRHDVSATRDQALGSMARTRGTGSIRGKLAL
jgi:hypothetical protein